MQLKSLDLFSGIGGFALGFHDAGIETVGFCEIEPFCQRVLAQRFPDVPIYNDVKELSYVDHVDIVAGGFPCQDISVAGKGLGLSGPRSRLWFEMLRIVGSCSPTWVVIENSPMLRTRGLVEVLGGLDHFGFDAEWHCIPASSFGASHRRSRLWIIAYARSARLPIPKRGTILGPRWEEERRAAAKRSGWSSEPGVVRVVHGVSHRVDRITALGNAVVPIIPEVIGRAIMKVYS